MKRSISHLILTIFLSFCFGCQKIEVKKNHLLKFIGTTLIGPWDINLLNTFGVAIDWLSGSPEEMFNKGSNQFIMEGEAGKMIYRSCYGETPARCRLCLMGSMWCLVNPVFGYCCCPLRVKENSLDDYYNRLEINPKTRFPHCIVWCGLYKNCFKKKKRDWKYKHVAIELDLVALGTTLITLELGTPITEDN